MILNIWSYQQKGRKILVVVNSTEEDFERVRLECLNVEFSQIKAIDRRSGKRTLVPYERKGDIVEIKQENVHLTTQTFLLMD